MDFTIVIPTHNRPDMLLRAVQSALSQTYAHYDVIVVDDASDRPAVLESAMIPRVTLLRSEQRLGAGAARNLGARYARRAWLAFLDDDDEFEPDFLRYTDARLQATSGNSFSWCSVKLINYDADGNKVGSSISAFPALYETEDDLITNAVSIGSGFGFAVRRDIFIGLGGFNSSYGAIEDTEFLFRLIVAGHRPVVVPEPLVRVHNHTKPRLTGQSSLRARIEECERLAVEYETAIARLPVLGNYLQYSLDHLRGRETAQVSERNF